MGLTNLKITARAGQAAFLPNQPIIHNCVVDAEAAAPLVPGAIVTFASTSSTNAVVVKQAANTDVPCGVVVYNAIASGFNANDKVSIFPTGSFVYLPAGAADLTIGSAVGFNSSNQVVADTTSGHGRIGILWTQPAAIGDLVVVEVKPGSVAGSMTDYLTTATAASTYLAKTDAESTYLAKADAATDYQAKLTAGDFIDISDNTITTTYTAGTGIEISEQGAISAT